MRKRKQKQWLPSVLGISTVLGYKVMSRFTVCIGFLLRVLQHISLERGKERFQLSALPMEWQHLCFKHLPSDKKLKTQQKET